MSILPTHSAPGPTAPEPQLPPALELLRKVWALNHALEQLSGRMVARLGVTAQQRLLVRLLGAFPGLTSAELAKLLHLDPGTISVTLRRLEAKGLVERSIDRADRRKSTVRLTVKGRRLDRPTPGTVERAVERVLATSSSREAEIAKTVLERLTESLERERAR